MRVERIQQQLTSITTSGAPQGSLSQAIQRHSVTRVPNATDHESHGGTYQPPMPDHKEKREKEQIEEPTPKDNDESIVVGRALDIMA